MFYKKFEESDAADEEAKRLNMMENLELEELEKKDR